MVFVSGLDSKTYSEVLRPDGPIPEIPCPDPACQSCLLRAHGWYKRYLGDEQVSIRRTLCPSCRVSHALLPEDVCAYQDLRLHTLEGAMEADGLRVGAQAAGKDGGPASRRQARRCSRSRLWQQLADLLGGPERLHAALGGVTGNLLRLRRWLWSKRIYLLAGPVGLFRCGRPVWPAAANRAGFDST